MPTIGSSISEIVGRDGQRDAEAPLRIAKTDLRAVEQGIEEARLIEHGFSSLWRGAVKVASAIPWLGKTQGVQNAANAIRASDTLRSSRFAQFTAALQSHYGDAVTTATLGITQLKPSQFLSVAAMRDARAVAENLRLVNQHQALSNRVEMNVWHYENVSKCGHVSLALHTGHADSAPLAANAIAPDRYISWWPGDTLRPDAPKGALIGRFAHAALGIDNGAVFQGKAILNYDRDAQAQLGATAQQGLASGRFQARSNQAMAGQAWGQLADARISLPFAGENHLRRDAQPERHDGIDAPAPDLSAHTPFGLSASGIGAFWTAVRNDKDASFEILSTTRNCSGMAAQALKAGGAEALLPIPTASLFLDPDTMGRYATALMTEVATLNAQAIRVDQTIGKMVAADAAHDAYDDRAHANDPPLSHAMRFARAQQAVDALPAAARPGMRRLCDALDTCREAPGDFEARQRQMKALVTGLHAHVDGPFGREINAVLQEAYQLYDTLRRVGQHSASSPS